MGTVTIRIPLVTWRDGKPRYWPSAAQRTLGFAYCDLRHDNGRWFSLDEAVAWSRQRQQEITERKQGSPSAACRLRTGQTTVRAHAKTLLTLSQSCDTFLRSPRMKGEELRDGRKLRRGLTPNTVRFYRQGARLLEADVLWHECLVDINAQMAEAALDRIEIGHGLSQARCARALMVQIFKEARKLRTMAHNPLEDVTLPVPAPRVRYGEPAEIEHFVAVADCLGRHDIGDAIVLGVWSGQRQNDRLAFLDARDTAEGLMFRQSKKNGQPLLIRKAAPLAARMAAARERRKGWKVETRLVLVDEASRAPWKPDWYRKVFAVIRHVAAFGVLPQGRAFGLAPGIDVAAMLAAKGLQPMPALADLHDQDLRDTAVTWLALAGCNEMEIASITGHSLKTIKDILAHYLGMHPELSRRAIGKLETWMGG